MSADEEDKTAATLQEKLLHEDAVKAKEKRSLLENARRAWSNVTVEPILAGVIISSMLSRLAVQNLNLDKACRVKLRYGDDICDSLIQSSRNESVYEREVQKVISNIEVWRSVIQTAIPMVIVIFIGAWSDRTGNRKVCILLPILGEVFVCVSNLISTYFFYEIPVEVTMFLEVIFPAVTGGWVTILLGVFSYISDITSDKDRTFRVGLVNLCMSAGIPVGTALSGVLLKYLGYYGIFAISGATYFVTFFYGYVYLKSNTKMDVGDVDIHEKPKPLRLTDIVSLVKETTVVAFRKRKDNSRRKILCTLFVVGMIYGPNHGERIVIYMYLRYRLQWDALKYSLYSTYSIITHSISSLFCITVFSKRLGLHDSVLCLMSVVSKLAGSLLIANVATDTHMFMVPIVEILNSTAFTSLRSMASKLVAKEEMGKINSILSLVETLAAMVFDPLYSGLYSRTLERAAGAVFYFSGALTLPAIFVLTLIFYEHRNEASERRRKLKQGEWVDGALLTSPQRSSVASEVVVTP